MNFGKIKKNKRFLLALIFIDLFGMCFAFKTYLNDFVYHTGQNKFFSMVFFPVSFWLFFLPFLLLLYVYFDKKIPLFLSGLTFVYCFVYGFGSFIFYPLFMIFIKGFSAYHIWNVFAHVFVGLQALLFYFWIKKTKLVYLLIFGLIFLVKDLTDLFLGGFLYFVKFGFSFELKLFLVVMIIILQLVALCLLWKRGKRLK